MRNSVAFLAGSSTGLLLGTLIGLSISPVVGTVIGALITVMTGFLGLKNDSDATATAFNGEHERRLLLSGFGLAALAGTFLGLTLRTHNTFTPSLTSEVAQLLQAGYEKPEALRLVAQRYYPADGRATTGSSVLFSATQEECDAANPGNLTRVEDILGLYDDSGARWKTYANVVRSTAGLTDAAKRTLLQAGWNAACS